MPTAYCCRHQLVIADGFAPEGMWWLHVDKHLLPTANHLYPNNGVFSKPTRAEASAQASSARQGTQIVEDSGAIRYEYSALHPIGEMFAHGTASGSANGARLVNTFYTAADVYPIDWETRQPFYCVVCGAPC